MGAMVNENNFGAVNTNDPKAKGFYIVKFTSLPYTLQENIKVDNDLIKEGSLVCEAEYMSPAQEGSLWYLIPKEGTISTAVDMGKVLIARLSVSVITSISQLDRSVNNLTLSNIIERKPFKLCGLDYDDIMEEISRKEVIEYDIDADNEEDFEYGEI